MESEKKISFSHRGFKYEIEKKLSEYVVDEPCGGGKSVNFTIEKGIPLKVFKFFNDDNYINIDFLERIEKIYGIEDLIIIEYEYNYIWELGFKDHIYMVILKNLKNDVLKYSFSSFENSLRRLNSKF